MTDYCSKTWLLRFISGQLDLDERLTYLFHLDACPDCWEAVYNATKAQHPHFYKMSARQMKLSEKELKKLDAQIEEIIEVA